DPGRDRFRTRHRRAEDRGPDRGQAAAARQRDGAGDALLPDPHAYRARRGARPGRRADRQVGWQGARARARREGVRLVARRGRRGMTDVAARTERYVADFAEFARNGASGAPEWLREIREGAIARFAELGFPTTKQEEWRFTSVAPIADAAFTLAPAPRSPLPAPSDIERLCVGAGPRVVFVDGRHAPTLSTPADLVGDVWAGSLAAALRTGRGRVQQEGPHSFQVATTHSRQERDSYLGLHVVTLGAALARHDITSVLDGAGAELILNGLYLLGGAQHADHHTVIDHAQPHCASHEFFNGVLAERAHGVFNGRIVVRPGAQRTDSKQTNNNLLLSTEARAD